MGQRKVWGRLVAVLCLAAAVPALAASAALVTITEGDAVVLRDTLRFAAAEGLALRADDIVSTGTTTRLLRIELEDGRTIDLGPATQLMLLPRALVRDGAPTAYLLQGWAKLTMPAKTPTPIAAATLATPRLDAARVGGTLIASVTADRLWLFAETGGAELQRRRDGKGVVQPLKDGDSYLLPAQGPGSLSRTPPAELRSQVPRAFIDTLPRRSARFAGRTVEPAKVSEVAYAEIAPWINGEAALRAAFVPRLTPRAKDSAFRSSLVAELKLHPEWQLTLFPPPPPPKKPPPAVDTATARAPETGPAPAAASAAQ